MDTTNNNNKSPASNRNESVQGSADGSNQHGSSRQNSSDQTAPTHLTPGPFRPRATSLTPTRPPRCPFSAPEGQPAGRVAPLLPPRANNFPYGYAPASQALTSGGGGYGTSTPIVKQTRGLGTQIYGASLDLLKPPQPSAANAGQSSQRGFTVPSNASQSSNLPGLQWSATQSFHNPQSQEASSSLLPASGPQYPENLKVEPGIVFDPLLVPTPTMPFDAPGGFSSQDYLGGEFPWSSYSDYPELPLGGKVEEQAENPPVQPSPDPMAVALAPDYDPFNAFLMRRVEGQCVDARYKNSPTAITTYHQLAMADDLFYGNFWTGKFMVNESYIFEYLFRTDSHPEMPDQARKDRRVIFIWVENKVTQINAWHKVVNGYIFPHPCGMQPLPAEYEDTLNLLQFFYKKIGGFMKVEEYAQIAAPDYVDNSPDADEQNRRAVNNLPGPTASRAAYRMATPDMMSSEDAKSIPDFIPTRNIAPEPNALDESGLMNLTNLPPLDPQTAHEMAMDIYRECTANASVAVTAAPDATADAPADAPADASVNAPADASADAPAGAPADAPADASAGVTANALAGAPAAPADAPAGAPAAPADAPAHAPASAPADGITGFEPPVSNDENFYAHSGSPNVYFGFSPDTEMDGSDPSSSLNPFNVITPDAAPGNDDDIYSFFEDALASFPAVPYPDDLNQSCDNPLLMPSQSPSDPHFYSNFDVSQFLHESHEEENETRDEDGDAQMSSQ
ncbi:hypothetical protein F5Y14DRAFT_458933 [Nemania sp. NC0429]|nr:hypothetical protein F5Y14DRAFT_458933 [Nemania sp. NC0429]